MVTRLDPAHLTTDAGRKSPPLTVKVNWADPTGFDEGERLVMDGTGLEVTTKGIVLDVPPPGAGLTTVMLKLPAAVRSEAGMMAVSWVAETYVVVRLDPAHLTTAPETKLTPLTVRVNCPDPTPADGGERLVMDGFWLGVTVNGTEFEFPPPGVGLLTVILKFPVAVRSEAGMMAVTWVAET